MVGAQRYQAGDCWRSCYLQGRSEFDNGFSSIQAIECLVSGSAKGRVPIHVHIHTHHVTFEDEAWRILTMTGGSFDHADQYTDLFAESCGSIGGFTDSTKEENGTFAISASMRDYNYRLRRINGKGIGQVSPFDPLFFYTKVHPNGALLYAPFSSQLTLLQHLCIQLEKLTELIHLISTVPKYWLNSDGTLSLHEENRWRSAATLKWLKSNGMTYVPSSIREEVMYMFHGGKSGASSSQRGPVPR